MLRCKRNANVMMNDLITHVDKSLKIKFTDEKSQEMIYYYNSNSEILINSPSNLNG